LAGNCAETTIIRLKQHTRLVTNRRGKACEL
jgi:hypothetical protein